MATSTIPALKAALQSQLEARTGLIGVQVSYGYPGPLPEPEYIWLGDAHGSQQLATAGNRARDERYQLTVLIKTETSGLDGAAQQTAVERAFALMAEIENELRANPSMDNVVRVARIDGPIDLLELAGAESRGALLTVTLGIEARI